MDKNLDIQIMEALKVYLDSGVEDQVDYQKFYLYSIVTHSTAIEGSTVTEIENQLLFDEGIAAKGRSLTEQMMEKVRKEDKGEYIKSLVDSRENEDSTIAQDMMLRHHIANLNRRTLQYKENDLINENYEGISLQDDGVNSLIDGVNDGANKKSDGVKRLNKTLQRVYQAIVNKPGIISSELMSLLSISESTVTRSTRELKKLGYIEREGSDKTGRWVILK